MELYQHIANSIYKECHTTSYEETIDKTEKFLESLVNTNVMCQSQPYCNKEFCEICQVGTQTFWEYVREQTLKLKRDIIPLIKYTNKKGKDN